MAGFVTKFRIKFGPNGSVKSFQALPPGINNCCGAKKTGEEVFSSADQSKKRGRKEVVQEVQAKKKQKQKSDSDLSSQCLTLKKKMIPELSGTKVTKGSKRQRGPETLASSRIQSAEVPKPRKEKPKKVPLSSKLVKVQSKKDTLAVTPKALATKSRTKKFDEGLGVSSAGKIPNEGSAPTASGKCDSCGRVMCICLKSWNSLGSDASSLTDCHVKNTSGSQASESNPNCNELKMVVPALSPLPPERALRAEMLKSKYAGIIQKSQGTEVLHKGDKVDLIRIQREREPIERTQREEKARIEAEMRKAKLATRMRAQAELNQQRERQRLEEEKMEKDTNVKEINNDLEIEKEFDCGFPSLTRARRRWFEEWGLVLRNDDCPEEEEMESKTFDAMGVDDLEEGEIDPLESL